MSVSVEKNMDSLNCSGEEEAAAAPPLPPLPPPPPPPPPPPSPLAAPAREEEEEEEGAAAGECAAPADRCGEAARAAGARLAEGSSKDESDEVKIDDGTSTCGSERRRRASASGAGEGAGAARGEVAAAGAGEASAPRTTDSARCEGRADRCTGSG
jgi:hypothetical protein